MHRFFALPQNIKGDVVILSSQEAHHMQKVLRLKTGDKVVVIDGSGNEFLSRIQSSNAQGASLAILEKRTGYSSTRPQLCLACAIPKGAKFHSIIEKSVELGVDRIIPLKTARTIVAPNPDRAVRRLEHWQKVAVAAAKQSGSNWLLQIERISDFKQAIIAAKNYDLALIPYLAGERKSFAEALAGSMGKSIIVFIGPEGDFTAPEIMLAKKAGCQPVSFGERVLKVDTAVFYALSCIDFARQIKR
ncbi:MAG: RsmE family RNA methyltransferase [Candidatus Omnitrophota bacterium]